jgi:hypothetical protein
MIWISEESHGKSTSTLGTNLQRKQRHIDLFKVISGTTPPFRSTWHFINQVANITEKTSSISVHAVGIASAGDAVFYFYFIFNYY